MKLTSDWHIHSQNSCDQACMPIAALIAGAAEKGILDFGLTDHLHTEFNLPDLVAARNEYDGLNPSPRFHFGVEVSVVSQWEIDRVAAGEVQNPVYGIRQGGPEGAAPALALTEQMIADLGIEYVVAGVHWPMYVPYERDKIIVDFHRQLMFACCHPMVDVVAHPWWWHQGWRDADGRYTTDPWLDDFGKIPQSMHDELAAAAIEHDTKIEINLSANLLNRSYPESFAGQYLEYLAGLKARGVTFSLASDCHSARYDTDFARGAEMLATIGLKDEEFWRLPPRAA